MVRHLIAGAASAHLDRDVSDMFVTSILDGDPFIYQAARDRDPAAARTVLALACGRTPTR